MKQEIQQIFTQLKNSSYKNIPGVIKIDSGKPGPTVAISACTHGNEPSGLTLIHFLLNNFNIRKELLRGSIIFMLNNIAATERYLSSEDPANKRQSRFIDINFNRIPLNIEDLKDDPRSEIQRFWELEPVFQEIDFGFDVHSTEQETDPIIISINEPEPEMLLGFPVEIVVTHIDEIQIGKAISKFYGGTKHIPSIVVETGSHESEQSFKIANKSALALLRNLEMISGKNTTAVENFIVYETTGSLMFPNHSYALTKMYKMFEAIKKDEVLATGDGPDLLAPHDGHIFMTSKSLKPTSIEEEVGFLSLPKRVSATPLLEAKDNAKIDQSIKQKS